MADGGANGAATPGPVDVPLPLGEPAHGPCAQLRDHRCDRPGAAHARPGGAAADGLGCLRPAGRERGDRAGRRPRRLDRPQHRLDAHPAAAAGPLDRLGAGSGHLPRRLLPLDPVAVPAVPRRRPGLSEGGHRELGPGGPDGARQRTGGRRGPLLALRRPGGEAPSAPVVPEDHRLRRPAARRPAPAHGLAGAGAHDAGQLDRPQHRR